MSPKYSDNPVVQRMRENSASIRRNVMPFAKHMTRSTIDGVGYVGTGISTIGTVATPFVPHIGFGLLAVGDVVSTASSLTSAGMNVMEGNVWAASFDVAMAGFGNAGPVGFKALKNSKSINKTDQVVLGSVYSFSVNILDVFRSKK